MFALIALIVAAGLMLRWQRGLGWQHSLASRAAAVPVWNPVRLPRLTQRLATRRVRSLCTP
jgi:hypothetical protein